MNIPPTLIVLIAVLLSVGSASAMLWLNYDAIFKKKPDIPAEFTSIEFDADDNEVKKEVPIIIKFSEISGSVEQDEATRVETLLQTPGGKGKLFLEQQGFGRAETIPSFVTPPQTGSLQRSIDLAKERRGKDG